MVNSRIVWIDYVKVVCIWLMVCCHAGQKGLILDITYQFHMPAFFIVSGILFHPKGKWITVKSFGIPVLVFGYVNVLCRYMYGMYDDVGREIIASWFRGYLFPSEVSVFQGYWFVLVLLLIRLLMEVDWIRRRKNWILIACIAWCCVETYIDVPQLIIGFKPYHVISCLPFFVTGMIIKESKIDVMRGLFEIKILAAAVFFILMLIQGRIDLSEYHYGVNYSLLYINALLGCWLLCNVCLLFPRRRWIELLSTGTLLILGLHSIMYGPLTSIFHRIYS